MRGRVLGAQNTVMLAAPAVTSAPLAAVAATAGLPVAGAVLAGRVDRIAELFGTFTSPVVLPLWLNISLALAGVLAGVERTLTLRRNRVLDVETMWTNL